MKKDFAKLINKTVQSLDWETIFEVHKVFKFGVGEGSEAIPGLKRKVYSESLSKNDIKNELKSLLKFVIENEISKFSYGPWIIFWFNQEWDLMFTSEEEFEDEEIEIEDYKVYSKLEVLFSPQRICLTVDAKSENESDVDEDDLFLKRMLKESLDSENYEVASKIQELIDALSTKSLKIPQNGI